MASRPSISELLAELRSLDEHPRIDAKAASQIGSGILTTVSAFANEPALEGGYLLLGVSRDPQAPGGYRAEGVANPDQTQADLASKCSSMFNRAVRPEMWVEEVEGGVLVAAYIAEADPGHKPIFLPAVGLPRGAYRRIGSTDQRCTEDDLNVFFHDRDRVSFDQAPVNGATIDELEQDAIAEYRRERERVSPGAEELAWSDPDLLKGIGCAVEVDGVLRPTVAGVLLFGSRALLRREFPMLRLDYIRVSGSQWVDDPERPFETVEMRDNLFRLVRRGEAAILDDLPRRISVRPGQIQREEKPRIPDRVIREALVNALMHRTYRSNSPTQVIRYSNRLEIRNPGYSLKAEDRLGEPGSETRNPATAAVLHEIKLAETKGSGIRVMRAVMKEANLTPPSFASDRGRDEFVASFYFHNLLDDEDVEWLAEFSAHRLSPEEARALIHARVTGEISNAVYRELNEVDTLDASAHLRRLRDLGILEPHEKGSATFYTLSENVLKPEKSRDLAKDSSETDRKIADREAGKAGVAEFSTPTGRIITLAREFGLPFDLAAHIAALKGWEPQEGMRRLVLRLCTFRAFSADDLSKILRRNRSYVLTQYVKPLLQSGDLEPTKPLGSRGQRYRARQQLDLRPFLTEK